MLVLPKMDEFDIVQTSVMDSVEETIGLINQHIKEGWQLVHISNLYDDKRGEIMFVFGRIKHIPPIKVKMNINGT